MGAKNKIKYLLPTAALLMLCFQPIVSLFVNYFRFFITLPFRIDTLFIYSVIIIITTIVFFKFAKFSFNIKIYMISLFILVSLLVSSFLPYANESNLIDIAVNFSLYGILFLFIMAHQVNFATLRMFMNYSAYIILFYVVSDLFIFGFIEILNTEYYSMTYAYFLYIPAIVFLNNLFVKNESLIINAGLFIITTLLLFAMGTRGPILFIIAYLFIKLFFLIYFYPKKQNIFLITIIGLTVLLIFSEYILDFIFNFIDILNLSSRIFDYLSSDSFLSSDGRIRIYRSVINYLIQNPIFGIGLGNDRVYITESFGYSQIQLLSGLYSHNIILEVLISYGLIIGSIIVIWFLYTFTVIFFKSLRSDYGEILLMFFAISVFPLMISGSFINYPLFFGLLGLMINQSKFIHNHYV
jgi:O-antigen ligase